MDADYIPLWVIIARRLTAHGGVVAFDTVLFFGGGARLLTGKIESSRVKVVVMEEPEFANAIGFRVRAEESAGCL